MIVSTVVCRGLLKGCESAFERAKSHTPLPNGVGSAQQMERRANGSGSAATPLWLKERKKEGL